MKVLGVFLGLVYGWCFIDLLVTSFLGMFLIGLTGYTTPMGALAAGFGNTTIAMSIAAFVFSKCLTEIGVCKAIAYWLLGRKILVGRPWVILVGMVVIGCFIGGFGGGMATMFLFWQVTAEIAEANGVTRGNRELNMIYAIIVYSVMTGGIMLPWRPGAILFGSFFIKATNLAIPAASFATVGYMYAVLTFGIMLILYRFVFRFKLSFFNMTEEIRQEYVNYEINKVQKIGLIGLALFMLGLLLPAVFKNSFMTMLSTWGLVGLCIIYIVFFAYWRDEQGKPRIDVNNCFKSGITWSVLMLVMVTVPVCDAMDAQEAGVTATIATFCSQLVGDMNVNVLILLVAIVIGFLSQFMHNLVMAAIFIPVFASIVIEMGGNPLTFFFAIYFALQCAYGTPAGSMMAGFVFGKEGMSSKDAWLHG